jgi:SAM-dependent methyltransferase
MTFYQNKIKEMTMVGWDFSYLEGKIKETDYPFNYVTIVKKYLKRDNQLLDLETGGGEVLLTLDHPFNNTTVTEGYKPNYELCLKRLKPKGVTVLNAFGDDVLPLEDHSFDVIINRHGSYSVSEIKRLLKPGGLFITQQVGGLNNLPLSQLLSPNRQIQPFNLHTELQQFKENGFILIESDEVYSDVKYLAKNYQETSHLQGYTVPIVSGG